MTVMGKPNQLAVFILTQVLAQKLVGGFTEGQYNWCLGLEV
jgi:hypothetical protein